MYTKSKNNYIMRVKNIIYFVLLFGVISCEKNPTQKIEKLIRGEDYQFWEVLQDHNYKGNYRSYEYFNKNGDWLLFEQFDGKLIEKWHGGDVYFYNEYRIMSDTVISITKGSLYWIDSIDYINKTFTLKYICDGNKIKKYIRPSIDDIKNLEELLKKEK